METNTGTGKLDKEMIYFKFPCGTELVVGWEKFNKVKLGKGERMACPMHGKRCYRRGKGKERDGDIRADSRYAPALSTPGEHR